MIAHLPMYDRPETRGAHGRLWQLVREHLPDAPGLRWDDFDEADWRARDLFLSQTCGLPYRLELHENVTLVGTPVHDLPCPPGTYFSAVVVRRSDRRRAVPEFDGALLAVNAANSQSGWAAPLALAAAEGIAFGSCRITGAHRASAKAVADGDADIAAIDAVTWRMIERWDGFAADLRVLAETPPTPALPYITSAGSDPAPLATALSSAIGSLSDADRDSLCLTGLTWIEPAAYLAVPNPPKPCLFGETA